MSQLSSESPRLVGDPPRRALGQLREALETKDWQGLGELLQVEEIWAFQRPMKTDLGIRTLKRLLDMSQDLHLQVDRVQKLETEGEQAHLSCSCCLMWGDGDSWTQHEFEFDVHLGLRSSDEVSRVTYFGVTIVTPEEISFVKSDVEKAAAARPARPPAPSHATAALDGHVVVHLPVLVPNEAAQTLLDSSKTDD